MKLTLDTEEEIRLAMMGKASLRALTEIRSALYIRKEAKLVDPTEQQPAEFTLDDFMEIINHHGINADLITSEPY